MREADFKEYCTDEITVRFYAKRCTHAAECLLGLPQVFNKRHRPWINPENATAAEVARVIDRCPSGALQYILHKSSTGD